MINEVVILPAILLLIAAMLKLFVGRTYSFPSIITAICELPVDILFLAISFAVTFTVATKTQISYGLGCCLVGIAVAILVILLWRACLDLFSRRKIFFLIVVLIINLFIAGLSLLVAVNLIIDNTGKEKTTKKETTQRKIK